MLAIGSLAVEEVEVGSDEVQELESVSEPEVEE